MHRVRVRKVFTCQRAQTSARATPGTGKRRIVLKHNTYAPRKPLTCAPSAGSSVKARLAASAQAPKAAAPGHASAATPSSRSVSLRISPAPRQAAALREAAGALEADLRGRGALCGGAPGLVAALEAAAENAVDAACAATLETARATLLGDWHNAVDAPSTSLLDGLYPDAGDRAPPPPPARVSQAGAGAGTRGIREYSLGARRGTCSDTSPRRGTCSDTL